jgi:hypothetical protein
MAAAIETRRRPDVSGPPGNATARGRRGLVAVAIVAIGVAASATLAHVSEVAVGAALAVPVLGIIYRRPQRGVLLVAALVPYDGLLLLMRHQSTVVRSWKEALVIITCAATFVCPPAVRAEGRRPRPIWLAPLAALIGYSVLSALVTSIHTGLVGLRIDFFYVILAGAIWRCPLDSRDLDRLVTIMMANAWITSAYGLLQQGLGAARLARIGYPYNATIRFTGSELRSFSTFVQPFPFAYFLMLALLLCVPVALQDPSRRRNRLFLMSLPAIGAALVLSFVRGALLGLAVGGLYLAWKRYRGFLMAAPLLVLVLLYLPHSVLSSVTASSSLSERGSGWAANLGHVIDHPLGQGVGTTGASAAVAAGINQASGATTGPLITAQPYQPDNYYYKELYELGVIGLWLYLVFIVSVAVTGNRVTRAGPEPGSPLTLGMTAFLFAAIAASVVSTFFEIFPMDVFFWMLVAILSSGSGVSATGGQPLYEAGDARAGGRFSPAATTP